MPIPPDATAINGFTDEAVRRDGLPAAQAIADIGVAVAKYIADGVPLVTFRASYDVTLLHTELARYGLPAIDWSQAVIIDPFILHKQVERDWFNKRTLGVLADYYQVRLDQAHDAASDAQATLDLAKAIAARHEWIAQMPLAALHEAQIAGTPKTPGASSTTTTTRVSTRPSTRMATRNSPARVAPSMGG